MKFMISENIVFEAHFRNFLFHEKVFLHSKDLQNDHFWQGDTLFCFTTLSRLVFFNLHLLSFNKCSLKSIKEINALIRKEMSNI